MIDVALQLNVGFPHDDTASALAGAKNGAPVDVRAPGGGRLTVDPLTNLARVEVATTRYGTFIAAAELPVDALAACLSCHASRHLDPDNLVVHPREEHSYSFIGIQFPVLLTLSQGEAVRRALESAADETVIDLFSGSMTITRDALDISADVRLPALDPNTMLPAEGAPTWNVHGSFHIGGQARAAFLQHIVERIAVERAKN